MGRAVEVAMAGETVSPVLLIFRDTREEIAALDAYHQAHHNPLALLARGLVWLILLPSITASEYLRQRGVVLPREATEGEDSNNREQTDLAKEGR